LKPGSPAIDAGMRLGYQRDFRDRPVPIGSELDMGAFEYALDCAPFPRSAATDAELNNAIACYGAQAAAGTPVFSQAGAGTAVAPDGTVYVSDADADQVVVLAGSRSQPVSAEQAGPVIEQYLLGERRRKLVEDDLRALRAAARIEYVGRYAELAASAPVAAASAPPPVPALPGDAAASAPMK
jgi:hypothetical protein